MNAPIYLVVCYVLVLIFISLFFVKKAVNSFEEYSLAGRSLSFVYIFLSYLGTWLSGGVILGLAASAFKWGFYQYWIIGAAYCFGFWASRLAILFTGLLAFSSCILIYDIFSLYISGAFLSGSIIVLPYLYTWFSRRMNSAGVIAGIIAGGTGFMIASIFLKLSNTTAMLIGLALNFLVSWSVALLCKKPAVEVVMNTYYWAPRFKGVKNIP